MELDKAEQTVTTARDLRFLRLTWDQDVSDDSLRISSPIVRKLLVEGHLQRAWKHAGFDREPTITGSTLKPMLARVGLTQIECATAGGALYKGIEMRGSMLAQFAMSPEDIQAAAKDGVPTDTLGLRAYIEAPGMVVQGREIPRRVIIKFIANVLGGVHYGSKGSQAAEVALFKRLDHARRTHILVDKPSVYFELLSIGQALCASADVRRLEEKILG
jgi:hypothetical protein